VIASDEGFTSAPEDDLEDDVEFGMESGDDDEIQPLVERNLELLDPETRDEVRAVCARAESGQWTKHTYAELMQHLGAATTLGALDCIDELLDDLQAEDSTLQRMGKELRRTQAQVRELESEIAERASASAAAGCRDLLTHALCEAVGSPTARRLRRDTHYQIVVGDGPNFLSRIKVYHWWGLNDIASVTYLLEYRGGYRLSAEMVDDTDVARAHLAKCHELAMALIDDEQVSPQLEDKTGVVIRHPDMSDPAAPLIDVADGASRVPRLPDQVFPPFTSADVAALEDGATGNNLELFPIGEANC